MVYISTWFDTNSILRIVYTHKFNQYPLCYLCLKLDEWAAEGQINDNINYLMLIDGRKGCGNCNKIAFMSGWCALAHIASNMCSNTHRKTEILNKMGNQSNECWIYILYWIIRTESPYQMLNSKSFGRMHKYSLFISCMYEYALVYIRYYLATLTLAPPIVPPPPPSDENSNRLISLSQHKYLSIYKCCLSIPSTYTFKRMYFAQEDMREAITCISDRKDITIWR